MDRDQQTHIELVELQKLVCADITFFKTQQWQAAYYGLLLYAAIAATPKVMNTPPPPAGLLVLGVIALIVLSTGLYVLSQLEIALERRREILVHARRSFTKEALTAYGAGDPNDALKPAKEKVSLNRVFKAAYVLGFSLTEWVLLTWALRAASLVKPVEERIGPRRAVVH